MRSPHRLRRHARSIVPLSAVVASALCGCGDPPDVSSASSALVAICLDAVDLVPASGWLCPNDLTIECRGENGTGDVDAIYYVTNGPACDGLNVVVNDPGPFEVGTHPVGVLLSGADASGGPLCSAELTVVDTEPPTATPHETVLWPPNHRMHAITPDDCVTVRDACDGVLHAQFTWASSDEPENDLGDGDTGPDIALTADSASLRGERQGTGDGRVYRLGFFAADAAGHSVEGSCTVVVPHDQSGRGVLEGSAVYTDTL